MNKVKSIIRYFSCIFVKRKRLRIYSIFLYSWLWARSPLDDRAILIESVQGASPFGNMFYVLKELAENERYKDFRLYYVTLEENVAWFRAVLSTYGMDAVTLIVRDRPAYARLLATAKYLVTDTAFDPIFCKREGQVIWNTWHGTPLKAMGRYSYSVISLLANVQKNLLADFLSNPNVLTERCLIDGYMIRNLATDTTLLRAGYPRNTAFFNAKETGRIRRFLGLDDKNRLYAYMPTWRDATYTAWFGQASSQRQHEERLLQYLRELDHLLDGDETLLVSLHRLESSSIDFSRFSHLQVFPKNIETYEVLAACDALATDYSSVMFDYAITRRKVVLFPYDLEEYTATRGLSMDYDALPFPKVADTTSLVDELRSSRTYDDRDFLEQFCRYEAPDAASRLVAHVLLGERVVEEEPLRGNGLPNVCLFGDGLLNNGITASLRSRLELLPRGRANYYLGFFQDVSTELLNFLKTLPEDIDLLPYIRTDIMPGLGIAQKLLEWGFVRPERFWRIFSGQYFREALRAFGSPCRFDSVVQYTGYGTRMQLVINALSTRRSIMMHADMTQEYATRRNTSLKILRYCYQRYDGVGVVAEALIPVARKIGGKDIAVKLVRNPFNDRRVRRMAAERPSFDPYTNSTVSLEKLTGFYRDDLRPIVSIGRFSPEKQHALLIRAFYEVWRNNPAARLVIIGGNNTFNFFEKTTTLLSKLPCRNAVALIYNMSNPFPLLAPACGFILSSKYEGSPMVILEAAALGVPVVTTDITATRYFVPEHGGTVVANSEEGIRDGLTALIEGRVTPMNIDFDAYNAQSTKEFLNLIGVA